MKIQLGDRVKDRVSGLVGIATSKVDFLNGCVQFGVEPKIKPGGKLITHYVDQQQLVKLRGGLNEKKAKKKSHPGRGAAFRSGGPQGHRTPPGMGESIETDANEYSEEN